jgi:hypothetical protein
MSKPPFPEIADEIRSAPKPKLDLAMKPRSVPESAIAEGARVIGEKWGSVTQLPAREAKVEPESSDRAKWPSIRVECPPYLDRELAMKAAGEGVTKTYLILKALADAGFTVNEDDLNKDKRKYRK